MEIKTFKITFKLPAYLDDNFWKLVPEHREYINTLMQKGIIFTYSVNKDRSKGWITMRAESEKQVFSYLKKSPLYSYWEIETDELFFFNNAMSALPVVSLN